MVQVKSYSRPPSVAWMILNFVTVWTLLLLTVASRQRSALESSISSIFDPLAPPLESSISSISDPVATAVDSPRQPASPRVSGRDVWMAFVGGVVQVR
jgi:hypothetical protein